METLAAVQVITTTDSRAEAERLARLLVEARLAACAQVGGPITSTYWWEGEVEVAEEWMVIVKTAADRLDGLVERLGSEHRYTLPEITATPIVAGSAAYLSWIHQETRPGPESDRARAGAGGS
jgi:periplasmic divalent cation tolerance protein